MNNRSTRNKLNLRAIIVLLAVLILALMFVFNLFKSNRNAKIAKEKVKANVTKVSKFNFSTVVDVEAELQKMKEAENGGSEDGKNYRTIFARFPLFHTLPYKIETPWHILEVKIRLIY